MSTTPLTPRTLKGALVNVSLTSLPSLVLFQYHPESVTRSLKPRRAGGKGQETECGGGSEALGVAGPPRETIRFTLEFDATDGLEDKNPISVATGVATNLAALETMIAPSQILLLARAVAQKLGILDALPSSPNLTLLFLGPARIMPVRIESLDVTEEAFDAILNPIRAKVDVNLTVLGPDDVKSPSVEYVFAVNYAVVKEALSLIGTGAAVGEGAEAVIKAVRAI
jgi:hypothetical protein